MTKRMSLRDELTLLRHGRRWGRAFVPPRSAEPWARDGRSTEPVNEWARTPTAVAVRRVLRRGLLQPVIWSQVKPAVYGIDHLENLVSPVIFVANHCSHLDAPLIVSSLPDRISDRLAVNAASDYYFDVRWRTIPAALFFNTFAVGRYGAAGRQASQAAQLLEDKWNILLFPEGTRGDDGTMGMFRLGAAQLSLAQGVPIVPVSLAGTYWAMPKGRSWPLPGRPPVIIRYGRPLFPQPGEGMRELRDRMMTAVAKLAAEENLGWYGAMRAQIDGSLPTRPARARSSRWRRTWESTRPLKAYSRRRTWRW